MTSASYYYRGDTNNVVSNNLVKNLYTYIYRERELQLELVHLCIFISTGRIQVERRNSLRKLSLKFNDTFKGFMFGLFLFFFCFFFGLTSTEFIATRSFESNLQLQFLIDFHQ